MAFLPSIWRPGLPTGAYQEGLDLVLGRYCALSFPDRIEITHFDRRFPRPSNPPSHERTNP